MASHDLSLYLTPKEESALKRIAGENGLSVEAQISQWIRERIKQEQEKPKETADWTAHDVQDLIAQLERYRTNIYQPRALQALYRLARIAREKPMPCLRAALPLLRPNWFMLTLPTEYAEIRATIEAATAQWKDLPVVAQSNENQENRDLPRLVEHEETNA